MIFVKQINRLRVFFTDVDVAHNDLLDAAVLKSDRVCLLRIRLSGSRWVTCHRLVRRCIERAAIRAYAGFPSIAELGHCPRRRSPPRRSAPWRPRSSRHLDSVAEAGSTGSTMRGDPLSHFRVSLASSSTGDTQPQENPPDSAGVYVLLRLNIASHGAICQRFIEALGLVDHS